MQRALVVSLLVAAVCAVLSCYLVLKGWSLMGDAISHAVLPGIVIAYIVGLPLALGAFVAGLSCALLTGYLKENSRIKEDTVMGIVFSGMFGFGLVLFTKIETDQHLTHILFGDVLGVTWRDLVETAIIAGGTLAIVLLKRRDLLLYCFDPNQARAIGLPVRVLHYGLLVLLALTIVAALKAVGIILVIAMLIGPGATAYLLTDNFDRMLPIAVAVALVSAAVGTVASFPPGRRDGRLHRARAGGDLCVRLPVRTEAGAYLLAPPDQPTVGRARTVALRRAHLGEMAGDQQGAGRDDDDRILQEGRHCAVAHGQMRNGPTTAPSSTAWMIRLTRLAAPPTKIWPSRTVSIIRPKAGSPVARRRCRSAWPLRRCAGRVEVRGPRPGPRTARPRNPASRS